MTKRFKEFYKTVQTNNKLFEETTSSDIATVDTKLDLRQPKHLSKGKRCRKHKKINCEICKKAEDQKYI